HRLLEQELVGDPRVAVGATQALQQWVVHTEGAEVPKELRQERLLRRAECVDVDRRAPRRPRLTRAVAVEEGGREQLLIGGHAGCEASSSTDTGRPSISR